MIERVERDHQAEVGKADGDEAIGVISVQSIREEGRFGEADVRLLATIASNVGVAIENARLFAEIERQRIPVFPGLTEAGAIVNVRDAVLHGGEEFALLFTSSLRESELSASGGRPVYAIGRIVAERGVRLDGAPLEPRGWDHFTSS